jgi:hypothetical protein
MPDNEIKWIYFLVLQFQLRTYVVRKLFKILGSMPVIFCVFKEQKYMNLSW